jgi:ABC-type sugar transport system substrate-binding protein
MSQSRFIRTGAVRAGTVRAGTVVTAAILLTALAACGSDADAGTPPDGASTGSSGAVEALEYDGPEAEVPAAYGTPEKVDGFDFTVGWLTTNTSNNFINAIALAGEARTEELGGEFILKNAGNDVSTQVDQCNELITQNVDAMAVYAVDPTSLAPCLADAAAAGIEIIGQDTPAIVGEPLFENYLSNVSQGPDRSAYNVATLAAEAAGSGSSFATLGIGIPIPFLTYYRERLAYWGEAYGLDYLGNADAATDAPQDAATAMNDIITRWPDVDVVLTTHDAFAEAALTTARAGGSPDILIYGNDGEASAWPLIEAGQLGGTNRVDTDGIGTQLIDGLYDALTEQNLPLPEQIAIVPTPVSIDNLDDVDPIE